MKNKTTYRVVILLLVLLNMAILTFMWVNRPYQNNSKKAANASEFLIRELGLTEAQQKNYLKLRNDHRAKMNYLSGQDKKLHNRFFDLLLNDSHDTARIPMMADSIADNRKEMEFTMYDHFLKVNKMLTPEQQKKFRSIFQEVLHMVLPPPPPAPDEPPPPPPPPLHNH